MYLTIAEIAGELGVSRQTLWRWRHKGQIPMGLRYRGRQVIFSKDDCELIRQFAQRLEPVASSSDVPVDLGTIAHGTKEPGK